jgi:hypothetical protein
MSVLGCIWGSGDVGRGCDEKRWVWCRNLGPAFLPTHPPSDIRFQLQDASVIEESSMLRGLHSRDLDKTRPYIGVQGRR